MIPMHIGAVPGGPPAAEHWPDGRGYWDQPAKFVESIEEIRSEWFHAIAPPEPKAKKAPAPRPPTRRRRK
jgi:hypothetical protein